jgi:hypothetical protein
MIEIYAETIDRVEALLAGVPKGAERALSNAMNRGLSKVKTGASKKVREVYTVQASAINEATTTKIQRSSTGNLAGYIHFSGYKIPLYKFKVTPKAPGTNKKVAAAVKKGGGTPFEHAFIAQMTNGHIGVFERETNKRFPIEEKMGLAMAQMVGNLNVIEALEKEAQKTVDERISHEIDRLLNGYGG